MMWKFLTKYTMFCYGIDRLCVFEIMETLFCFKIIWSRKVSKGLDRTRVSYKPSPK